MGKDDCVESFVPIRDTHEHTLLVAVFVEPLLANTDTIDVLDQKTCGIALHLHHDETISRSFPLKENVGKREGKKGQGFGEEG
jgi:phosphosulfolactate phosphohydrolase-like enzyme